MTNDLFKLLKKMYKKKLWSTTRPPWWQLPAFAQWNAPPLVTWPGIICSMMDLRYNLAIKNIFKELCFHVYYELLFVCNDKWFILIIKTKTKNRKYDEGSKPWATARLAQWDVPPLHAMAQWQVGSCQIIYVPSTFQTKLQNLFKGPVP